MPQSFAANGKDRQSTKSLMGISLFAKCRPCEIWRDRMKRLPLSPPAILFDNRSRGPTRHHSRERGGADALPALEETLRIAGLERVTQRAADVEAAGRAGRSFLKTTPPFITNLTRSISVISVSGFPETPTRSANLPFSTLPTWLPKS